MAHGGAQTARTSDRAGLGSRRLSFSHDDARRWGSSGRVFHGLVRGPIWWRRSFSGSLPAWRRLGNPAARTDRGNGTWRRTIPSQSRDYPEGREPDVGLLLVRPARGADSVDVSGETSAYDRALNERPR